MYILQKIKFPIIAIVSCVLVLFANSLPSHSQTSPTQIALAGTIRDFSDSHPDFERSPGEISADESVFRYALDRGIVSDRLGADNLPVYAGGSFSTTTEANFNQWFRNVDSVNQSLQYPIVLSKTESGIYRYENRSFFPIDGLALGNEGRSHNYHFTYQITSEFTYSGGEEFKFSGDDDVWVYLNGYKAIDIGGVHSRQDDSVALDDIAEAAGLEVGQTYSFNFFFAERHTTESNFIIETNIAFEAPILFAD